MMKVQWIGALLMIAACGGIGFAMAMYDKRELSGLRQLQGALEYMRCELNCRLTPLPVLLRKTAGQCSGGLQNYLVVLSEELENQIAPDVFCCVKVALERCNDVSEKVREILMQLGQTMGVFDLEGQLKSLEIASETCERICKKMEKDRPQWLRSYPTLGLCIGAVVAILFI